MEMIVFTGLQGSGKSSFFRERFASTHVHISKDHFPNARNRDRRQEQLIREAARKQQSVVVDNTNPDIESRTPLIRLGRELGMELVCYAFDVDVKACYERNALREGKAKVPDVGFFATLKKLQPPTHAEGFDQIFRVRLKDKEFEVTKDEG
jgi:predicted kinase